MNDLTFGLLFISTIALVFVLSIVFLFLLLKSGSLGGVEDSYEAIGCVGVSNLYLERYSVGGYAVKADKPNGDSWGGNWVVFKQFKNRNNAINYMNQKRVELESMGCKFIKS